MTAVANGIAEAVAALRSGDAKAAKTICDSLLAKAPLDPGVHQLAATTALALGDAAGARSWAMSGLSLSPAHPPLLLVAARAARACGEPAAAVAYLRRASGLAPPRADVKFLLCATYIDLRDSEALPLLNLLIGRFPQDADGWKEIGAAWQRAGQIEAALLAVTRAARASPSMKLELWRGDLLQALARFAEAEEAFRSAQRGAPDETEPGLRLGLCLRQAGQAGAARSTLEQVARLAPADARVWFALGLVRQDDGDLAEAVSAYRAALTEEPRLAEAAVNLGICLQEAGDLTGAKDAYREAVRSRADTFGRIAQALATAPTGELWLDLEALRRSLAD